MGICWYCYWGWPEQVAAIYRKYSEKVSDPCSVLDYGPGHMVWADENFETHSIKWCLDNAEIWRRHEWDAKWPKSERTEGLRLSDSDFELAVDSLKELLAVPDDIRCCEPNEYDDEHPEKFPPPSDLVMLHRHQ